MCARRQIDWAACASRVASAIPRSRLHPAVLAWANNSSPRERWAVGFSGGADSLLLLLLLWAHWPEGRSRMVALHFNHRLRGAAATADERFCQRVCASLGMEIAVGRWSGAPAKASEAVARAARQAFFAEQLARIGGRAVWLGHQQDDVAETLLMRLARGSGPNGLAAPRPVQPMPRGRVHLRPLLNLGKVEIVKTLEACGATWCEDASNAGGDYFRTRIRRDVIPAWRAAAEERDVVAGAALARELIQEDDDALSAWVGEIAPIRQDGSLSLRRLHGKPRAVVRRALHLWFARQRRTLAVSRQCFAALLESVMAGRRTRHSIGAGCFAEVGKSRLVLRTVRQKNGRGFQRTVN